MSLCQAHYINPGKSLRRTPSVAPAIGITKKRLREATQNDNTQGQEGASYPGPKRMIKLCTPCNFTLAELQKCAGKCNKTAETGFSTGSPTIDLNPGVATF